MLTIRGEHIHHGYYLLPSDTKEVAQIQLIELLLEQSGLPSGSNVLDVGCGIGGTSRYLAKNKECKVTGVTISGRQVEIAKKLTAEEAGSGQAAVEGADFIKLGDGGVRYVELDAERMGEFFGSETNKKPFDCVWISEAMSHLPDKNLFFRNAASLLNLGGKLVVADWFKAENLTDAQMDADIKPIEGQAPFSHLSFPQLTISTDGMLLPPLCSQIEYVQVAEKAGLSVFKKPFDISKNVSKTW